MLGLLGTVAAVWMIYSGTIPLRYGRIGPYSQWTRVAGSVLLVGIWLPMGWLGAMFGNTASGEPIVLVIGLIFLIIGIIDSISR